MSVSRKSPRRYSVAQARDRFTKLVHEAERGACIEVTRRGKPVAVLISAQARRADEGGAGDFWDAVQRFRAAYGAADAGIDVDDFAGLRDRSSGRDFEF